MIQQATLDRTITDGMNSAERFVKRLFDIVAALVGIIVLSPVFLIVYIKPDHLQARTHWLPWQAF